jgi:hypothetical protein
MTRYHHTLPTTFRGKFLISNLRTSARYLSLDSVVACLLLETPDTGAPHEFAITQQRAIALWTPVIEELTEAVTHFESQSDQSGNDNSAGSMLCFLQ